MYSFTSTTGSTKVTCKRVDDPTCATPGGTSVFSVRIRRFLRNDDAMGCVNSIVINSPQKSAHSSLNLCSQPLLLIFEKIHMRLPISPTLFQRTIKASTSPSQLPSRIYRFSSIQTRNMSSGMLLIFSRNWNTLI